MMHAHRTPLLLLALAACHPSPTTTKVYNGPESLLLQSQEIVNVPLTDAASIKEMTRWIKRDRPATVELQCQSPSATCTAAEKALRTARVPFSTEASAANGDMAVLYYLRVGAADCDSRVVDYVHNVNNLAAPNIGCSVSSNSIRMISDSDQLTNPAHVGAMDAEKTGSVIKSYKLGTDKLSKGSVEASSSD